MCATLKEVQDNVLEDSQGSMLFYTDIVTDKVIEDFTALLLAVLLLPLKSTR